MVPNQEFRFSYGRLKPLLSVLGAGPSLSSITLDDECLRVRMNWLFSIKVPRSSITCAKPFSGVVGGWGANWVAGPVARERVVEGHRVDLHRPSGPRPGDGRYRWGVRAAGERGDARRTDRRANGWRR